MNQQIQRLIDSGVIWALSIRQPWAWLITNGPKDIENRRWYTQYRGVFAVHASKKIDLASYQEMVEFEPELNLPDRDKLELGGIVGTAKIVDCLTVSDSEWFEGPYGFKLEERYSCDFIPCNGRLGIFDLRII